MTITIYGASDDLVEVAGCEGADEFSTDSWSAELNEKSPGQAAYEAFQRAFPDEDWRPWDMLDGDGHEGWEAAAQAATAANHPLADVPPPELARLLRLVYVGDIGSVNYAGYRSSAQGRSLVSGAVLPEWEAQPGEVRRAWQAGGEWVVGLIADSLAVAAQQQPGGYADVIATLRAERDDARAQLAAVRDRMDELAASLEESAAKTEPSKKSDIERQTARRVRDIAGRPF